jgi:acyl-phosphate glycerol 3-phosphate acyltransferase
LDNLTTFYPILAAIAAYLVGSLSFAVIVSKLMGLNDPRTFGSKNPGATNVLRSGSKPAAILTLVLDALKGYIPVALVQWFGKDYGLWDGTVAKALPQRLAWCLACIGRWACCALPALPSSYIFSAGYPWRHWLQPLLRL